MYLRLGVFADFCRVHHVRTRPCAFAVRDATATRARGTSAGKRRRFSWQGLHLTRPPREAGLRVGGCRYGLARKTDPLRALPRARSRAWNRPTHVPATVRWSGQGQRNGRATDASWSDSVGSCRLLSSRTDSARVRESAIRHKDEPADSLASSAQSGPRTALRVGIAPTEVQLSGSGRPSGTPGSRSLRHSNSAGQRVRGGGETLAGPRMHTPRMSADHAPKLASEAAN